MYFGKYRLNKQMQQTPNFQINLSVHVCIIMVAQFWQPVKVGWVLNLTGATNVGNEPLLCPWQGYTNNNNKGGRRDPSAHDTNFEKFLSILLFCVCRGRQVALISP